GAACNLIVRGLNSSAHTLIDTRPRRARKPPPFWTNLPNRRVLAVIHRQSNASSKNSYERSPHLPRAQRSSNAWKLSGTATPISEPAASQVNANENTQRTQQRSRNGSGHTDSKPGSTCRRHDANSQRLR